MPEFTNHGKVWTAEDRERTRLLFTPAYPNIEEVSREIGRSPGVVCQILARARILDKDRYGYIVRGTNHLLGFAGIRALTARMRAEPGPDQPLEKFQVVILRPPSLLETDSDWSLIDLQYVCTVQAQNFVQALIMGRSEAFRTDQKDFPGLALEDYTVLGYHRLGVVGEYHPVYNQPKLPKGH